ncbi:AraC family transcriptional regulator [Shimia sp. R9_2]|uniref:AraC family transcriptional regulator n=1 Tax=Shimia sp. R9_2 TaxID=2821112 RepID=UPI001AD960F2|nr:AraC family transcriptional regulator [Shimia sp. R9_2]MBO9396327.1 AraC family transcriptional regulator [Shimia sp. R9_2]
MIVRANTRSATILKVICEHAEKLGVDVDACLEGSGISQDEVSDPQALHNTEQELQIIMNFMRLAPRSVGLGWIVGRDMHVHAFGIWGFAILTSPTLRSAIETSLDYINLSSSIADYRLEEFGERAQLTINMDGIPDTAQRFILERHCAISVNFIQEILLAPGQVGFTIETPEPEASYGLDLSMISNLPVQTGQPAYALSFPSALLDQPLAKSDPVSLRFCLEQCEALSQNAADILPPWSQKVRDAIMDNISSEHKIEEISERLTVTERTLRRRLTEEGTSFRELYADVRMALAHELLQTAGLNVETVAWRVGYSEPASFARAFSKKFGQTPGEVRRSNVRRVA